MKYFSIDLPKNHWRPVKLHGLTAVVSREARFARAEAAVASTLLRIRLRRVPAIRIHPRAYAHGFLRRRVNIPKLLNPTAVGFNNLGI